MGKDWDRYHYENSKNGMKYYGGYQPAPTAPTLDITINQNNPGVSGGRRAPSVPPPLPPVACGEYAQPAYNPIFFDRFPRRENRGMFRLCMVEAMLAAVIFGGGIWCYHDTAQYCPYYSAIWTSCIYLINAVVGSVAAKTGNPKMYISHLILSLIAGMMCVVSGIVSARNWSLVGTYHHPRIDRDEAFCLLGTHDTTRLSYIFTHMDKYDFARCLWQLKVGVAVNSVQFVVAALEILLNLLSAVLCLKRVCGTPL